MIYLDNAATTKLAPEALEAMLPYLQEHYGNPSAVYGAGSKAKKALSDSRRTVAGSLGCDRNEIFFTSGGTESDNWALMSAAKLHPGGHLITTGIEHHAILHTCKELERGGYRVTYLPVDSRGLVDPEDVRKAICKDTFLVSVMFANNEIGVLEPIREIGQITKEKGILFHTDAVQAYGHVPISVRDLNIDLLSASAHKFHGPKGVGFLYVREGLRLPAFLQGGGQERGLRSGTENVAGIVGLGAAAKLAMENREENAARQKLCRDYLQKRLTQEIPDCTVNGEGAERLPGTLSVCVPPVEGESVLIQLDMRGICASSGSACTIGSNEPSHVLVAIGRTPQEAKGSLRFTVSETNTLEEMDRTAEAVKEIVGALRRLMGWKCSEAE